MAHRALCRDLAKRRARFIRGLPLIRVVLGQRTSEVSHHLVREISRVHELRPFTAAQVRDFLAHVAADRLATLYTVTVGLGLRQGEALALRWQDVDMDAGTVTIRHTLRRRTHELATTKTERSRRTLFLPASVATALREHRRRQLEEWLAAGAKWQDRDLVFTTRAGRALDSRHVTVNFQAALVDAGLPRQRFHDLRHACATLLIEQGEELAVVSRMLGHSNLSTTADVYAHLTRDMQRRAAERMESVLTPHASAL